MLGLFYKFQYKRSVKQAILVFIVYVSFLYRLQTLFEYGKVQHADGGEAERKREPNTYKAKAMTMPKT